MKCDDSIRQSCNVEKMGCDGCFFDVIKDNYFIKLQSGEILQIENQLFDLVIHGDRYFYKQYYAPNKFIEVLITNYSEDIIDLIQVGDYVNNHRIAKIVIDPFNNKKQLITEHWEYNWQGDGSLLTFHTEDIESVLTKTQYQANCYTKHGGML